MEVVEQGLESPLSGNSLAVQWLGLRPLTAEGPGSIPGRSRKPLRSRKPCGAAKKEKKESPLSDCRIHDAFFKLKKKAVLI